MTSALTNLEEEGPRRRKSTDVSGSNIAQKLPSESDEQVLKELVKENEFFQTRTDYPSEKEDENLVTYALTLTVGNNAGLIPPKTCQIA